MGFVVVFQASTGKELWENNHGNNYGTRKFDAKHFATFDCPQKHLQCIISYTRNNEHGQKNLN